MQENIYPNNKTFLKMIQGWTTSYKLQEQNAKRININFLIYDSMHEIFRSEVPGIFFRCKENNENLSITLLTLKFKGSTYRPECPLKFRDTVVRALFW